MRACYGPERWYDNDNSSEEIEEKSDSHSEKSELSSERSNVRSLRSNRRLSKDTKIRLAHFSVKEYLESKRII